MAAPGDFWLRGLEDSSDIEITHSEWPGVHWRLMIPEYGWISDSIRARMVEWPVREGREVSWKWCADRETKEKALSDFRGSAKMLSPEEVGYVLTFRNVGKTPWGARQSSLICLISGDVPDFHDPEGHRTFAYACASRSFVDIDAIQKGKWADHRMWGGRVPAFAGPDRPAVERFMVKVSASGEHVLGIATDDALGVSCNHQIPMSCIHSNPFWGPLAPGQEKTVHGKIYLFRGDLGAMLARYRRDFGMVCGQFGGGLDRGQAPRYR